MNLLALDQSFIAIKVIDDYKSMIWTDRYQEAGDFELVTKVEYRDFLQQGYYLFYKDSEHLMIIEGLQIDTDPEEGNYLTVTGRSLESILDRRVVWKQTTLDSTLQVGIKKLITENIISPEDDDRKISNFIFEDTDDSYIASQKISAQYTGDNIYDVMVGICEDYNIGFKVTLNSSNQFVFKLYHGVDRSYNQLANPFVIFSPSFDNVISSQYVESGKDEKNVALVLGEESGTERRRSIIGSTSGLSRKEHYVDARDIQSNTGDIVTNSASSTVNYTKFDEKVYFDYSTGTVLTHETSAYKSVKIPCAPNTKYKLSRAFPSKKLTFQIGGFNTEPAVGSVCVVNQKWQGTMVWEDDDVGQYGKGNIDLYNRPEYVNEDGSVSTVLSMSFQETEGGQEILIPTVVLRNNVPTILSESEAKQWYTTTGEYLGKFDNVDASNNYAEMVHDQQSVMYPDYDDSISNECFFTFTTGENVNWLVVTLNDTNFLEKTFDQLLDELRINGTLTEIGYATKLNTRGSEKLADLIAISSFEGEVEYRRMFTYGRDFKMGDICEFENEYGMERRIMVSELVMSQDANGYSVYPTFKNAELKYEDLFQKLQYIEGVGTAYFDMGIELFASSTNKLYIENVVDPDESYTSDSCPMGARTSANGGYKFPNFHNGLWEVQGPWGHENVSGAFTGKQTLVFDYRGGSQLFIADNLQKMAKTSDSLISSNNTLYCFAMHTDTDVVWGFHGKMYSSVGYINGVKKWEYVPSKRNSDNKVGMYDTVTKTFYYSNTVVSFIAGPVATS